MNRFAIAIVAALSVPLIGAVAADSASDGANAPPQAVLAQSQRQDTLLELQQRQLKLERQWWALGQRELELDRKRLERRRERIGSSGGMTPGGVGAEQLSGPRLDRRSLDLRDRELGLRRKQLDLQQRELELRHRRLGLEREQVRGSGGGMVAGDEREQQVREMRRQDELLDLKRRQLDLDRQQLRLRQRQLQPRDR